MHASEITGALQRFRTLRYRLILQGIGAGVAAALVVIFFRLLLGKAETFLHTTLEKGAAHGWFPPVWFLALGLAAYVVYRLVRWEPYISGSGIPQVEAEVNGHIETNWWRVILAKYVGGTLAIGAGLSLGREGPSIQLGAMAAKGYSRLTKRPGHEERFLITCGAGAGLAAAFNAPFAGVLFALEEVHKNFSPEVLLSTMASAVTADFLSRNVFGLSPVFDFGGAVMLPLGQYGHLVVLGMFLGFAGVLYNTSVGFFQRLYDRIPRKFIHILIPFMAAGVLAFACPELLGGGHHLAMEIEDGHLALGILAVYLVLKFLFSMLSFGSGAPGGIFLPLLVMGAMLGGLYSGTMESLFGLEEVYLSNFVIFGMSGFFAAIVRAPITGIILISEMTGSLQHMLSLSVVSLAAYLVPDMLRVKPIYEQLMARLVEGKSRSRKKPAEKILLDTVVSHGSPADGKKLSELSWPEACLVVSLLREEAEFVPKGDTVILGGDRLVLLCDAGALAPAHEALEHNCQTIAE